MLAIESGKFIWQLINALIAFVLPLGLVIWIVVKLNSIDRKLKELLQKIDK